MEGLFEDLGTVTVIRMEYDGDKSIERDEQIIAVAKKKQQRNTGVKSRSLLMMLTILHF